MYYDCVLKLNKFIILYKLTTIVHVVGNFLDIVLTFLFSLYLWLLISKNDTIHSTHTRLGFLTTALWKYFCD